MWGGGDIVREGVVFELPVVGGDTGVQGTAVEAMVVEASSSKRQAVATASTTLTRMWEVPASLVYTCHLCLIHTCSV